MAKNKGGRPTVMKDEILQKLESVFSYGAPDDEACVYADISPSTLYNYQKQHPEFLERKRLLKNRPILKARQTVVDNLGDPKVAQWFLEHKAKQEFSIRTESIVADVTIEDILKEFDKDPDDRGEDYE